jgi:putative tricarboxylic transport membrane protein
MFDGSAAGFFTRPISATLLVVFVVVAVLPLVRSVRERRAASGGGAVEDGTSAQNRSAQNREEESV